ncbi:protein kinase domain-containing protein [Diplodia corticola]|uniref:Protein kinase domain-containing protein n=1 Tax=Diplodia corticola TaxID=236234 RepID=A0A1J9R9C8_9PEZI|nr:protein kinase domain-containing protein [Diplodia corticola]OJD29027.1 protein kinase domain-containing protein [Diplodia corticola]
MPRIWKRLTTIIGLGIQCFRITFRNMIGFVNLFRRHEDAEELRKKLQAARVEYPAQSHQFFVPNSSKDSILTKEVIASVIHAARPKLGCNGARDQAERVCAEARNLFAILAYLKKGQDICSFLDEGISDKDLPFERIKNSKSKFALQRKDRSRIETLDAWEEADLESLGGTQWCMIAPIFKDETKHYKFHMNTVLPFMDPEGDEEEEPVNKSGGGYSEVFTTRIHPAHHKFDNHWALTDRDHKVAIKRLHKSDSDEFEKERSIHTTLGQKKNASPHLVKLLATYEYKEKYHFIFPRADCNLRKYWNKNPTPEIDKKHFLWSLKQMYGIAKALNIIHNFRVTVKLDGKGRTSTGGVEFSVTKGEELFGRHGDIKPENILWFRRIPEHQYKREAGMEDQEGGVLQITDFGLGRFHGQDSKTEPQPNGVVGSPTYEPPECRLRRPVSRAYDLWSLGCLYLEFATWLIMGFDAIDHFSESRLRTSSLDPAFAEDYFFTVVHKPGGTNAEVRDDVVNWAQRLHEHPNCSKFIHDLVDLIMKDLLVVEAKDRIHARGLCDSFKDFLEKAKEDENYLCNPDPRPRKGSSRQGGKDSRPTQNESHTMSISPPKTSPKKPTSPKKSVAFEDEGSSSKSKQAGSRDLVDRSAGTLGRINENQN